MLCNVLGLLHDAILSDTHLFSFYKLPHSRNMHSYRPCPLLQRTIPTTSSLLNPRHQKRLRGRKGKLHQYQISNIISFLYYYLLFSVHVNDNSTYHSSHSHVTLPSAPCLNHISHYSNIVIMILPLYIYAYLTLSKQPLLLISYDSTPRYIFSS